MVNLISRARGIASAVCTFALLSRSEALRPSPGCSKADISRTHAESSDAGLTKKQIQVIDFENVERTYWLHSNPNPAEPAPLLVAIHGQGGQATDFAAYHNFSSLGTDHNLMVVFPQGMDDAYPGEEQGTGWNAGSAGDNATCIPAGTGSYYGCYKSCRALKKCGRCNWSTCYDDVLFIKTLIKTIGTENCIDLDRIYAHGESNGAMMVQHLVRELPDTFAGVDTWFGTPLVGYLLGQRLNMVTEQASLSKTAYLSLHGRNDTCIPPAGGVDDSGWIYEPLEQSTGIWAALHHCDRKATPLKTRWDGGPKNFRCIENMHCSSGRRIVQCMYDGVHGDWPTGHDGDEITLWFLLQFSRSTEGSQTDEPVALV